MKVTATLVMLVLFTSQLSAQEILGSQAARLHQYVGHWVSSEHAKTDKVGALPAIKMNNTSTMDGQSIQVEVLQYQQGQYQTVLTELIGYDSKTEQIIALGQNQDGVIFKGEGGFLTDSHWKMRDRDMLGDFYMSVEFDFQSPTNVLLKGFDKSGKNTWETRYIKANPKDKNIGIQLVSVHQDMLHDPVETLGELGRMGYRFVETFVYDQGTFYGMSPVKFRQVVQDSGMRFLGSMTFYDLPASNDWQAAMDWWSKTIRDHAQAGVKYLTTSNNQLSSIQNLAQLQRYAEYYNAIGKLCKEQGISFAFHNHADEFMRVEDVLIYDYLLENTEPDYVSFQADIYWMHVAGVSPQAYFTKYPKRFLSWHIKDYKELGASGKIDWAALFNHTEFDPPQYMVAEVEDYSYPPLYSAQLAWEYLYYTLLK